MQLSATPGKIALGAALSLVLAGAAAAAAPAGISSDEAKGILEELRQIRALLERMQAPVQPAARPAAAQEGPVTARLNGAYVLGKADAPLTLVEFTDYECPFCRQFHMASFEELKRKYVDSGKLRYVSRDFPLDFHPNAMAAAKAARCAGEQGRFWEMRKALIVNGNALAPQTMLNLGAELKLDAASLQACLASNRFDQALSDEMAHARALGVSGTPTFVLGRSQGDAVEGIRIVGAQPLAVFEARIQALLAAPQ